jgi:hypothetical protein
VALLRICDRSLRLIIRSRALLIEQPPGLAALLQALAEVERKFDDTVVPLILNDN